jgi:hypothetical protein
MAKKKTTARSSKRPERRSGTSRASHVHGVEHDFILIAGGGFVLLVLVMVFLFN